jgi:hypothetical protein
LPTPGPQTAAARTPTPRPATAPAGAIVHASVNGHAQAQVITTAPPNHWIRLPGG